MTHFKTLEFAPNPIEIKNLKRSLPKKLLLRFKKYFREMQQQNANFLPNSPMPGYHGQGSSVTPYQNQMYQGGVVPNASGIVIQFAPPQAGNAPLTAIMTGQAMNLQLFTNYQVQPNGHGLPHNGKTKQSDTNVYIDLKKCTHDKTNEVCIRTSRVFRKKRGNF